MSRRNPIEIDSRELDRQLKKAIRRNPELAAKKVTAIALDLAGRSARLAPVDTGDLRNNCSAEINGSTVFTNKSKCGEAVPALKLSAEIGYSLPYALRQHEELGYKHPKGGQAKFLEQPFSENEQKYIDMLKSIPDEALR